MVIFNLNDLYSRSVFVTLEFPYDNADTHKHTYMCLYDNCCFINLLVNPFCTCINMESSIDSFVYDYIY